MKKVHAILTIKELSTMSEHKQLSLLVWLTRVTNDLQHVIENREHKKYAKTYRIRYIK